MMNEFEEMPEEIEEVVQVEQDEQEEQGNDTRVPLVALQKERKKRQELERELEIERQKKSAPVEEDLTRYESVTREDLSVSKQEMLREVEEKLWIKQNREKYEFVNENLDNFLKQRPNLISAIKESDNRYEEAFTLMQALTPKQQRQLSTVTSKQMREAPQSPSSIPKAAMMDDTVDVMQMTDDEFRVWRRAQKKR